MFQSAHYLVLLRQLNSSICVQSNSILNKKINLLDNDIQPPFGLAGYCDKKKLIFMNLFLLTRHEKGLNSKLKIEGFFPDNIYSPQLTNYKTLITYCTMRVCVCICF